MYGCQILGEILFRDKDFDYQMPRIVACEVQETVFLVADVYMCVCVCVCMRVSYTIRVSVRYTRRLRSLAS